MSKMKFAYFIISLAMTIVIGYLIVPRLRAMMIGQSIREEGPKSHYGKAGTPTIGGIIFIFSALLSMVLFKITDSSAMLSALGLVLFGILGFVDDYIKVVKKRNLGLKAKQKLLGQFLASIIIVCIYGWLKDWTFPMIIPFSGGKVVYMGILGIPLAIFILVASTNSVNLTDGLDGLAGGLMVIYLLTFLLLAHKVKAPNEAWIMVMIGAVIGFLHFNHFPAKVFMGDTGSLALGGVVACLAFSMDMALFIPIAGLVFVLETLSVMIQVFFYKKWGKRVFLMSPLHHHFEQKGIQETKVVTGFYLVGFACGILAYLAI